MLIRLFFIVTLLLLSYGYLFSAGSIIEGQVVDSLDSKPLPGATVSLISISSDLKYHDITNRQGNIKIENVKQGNYELRISYIGYQLYSKNITVTSDKPLKLGKILMQSSDILTKDILVLGDAPIGEQKGDTTEFRAESFKTMPDATAEDLVKKMPGVQVEPDGTVKAKGEEVKKVLVDGKPFFGDDPTATLRNLPSEIVDRIQIFDGMSEQAEFTGFDDGQRDRTMNILTRANRRKGEFGRFSAGYGLEDRYNAGISFNIFDGDRRISVLGITNNINQQNFSPQDIYGSSGGGTGIRGQFIRTFGSAPFSPGMFRGFSGGGRSGGFGSLSFFFGQLDGITTTHAYGINYSDYWTEKISVSGSYFFNYGLNNNEQFINREIFSRQDEIQLYDQFDNTQSINRNHRFNFRMEYKIDTSSSLIIRPSLFIQANNNISTMDALTKTQSFQELVNSSSNNNSNYENYNFSNEILLRHKFQTPGRTISVSLNTNINNRDGRSWQISQNNYANPLIVSDTINQTSFLPTNGLGLTLRTVYTEPLAYRHQLLFSYDIGNNLNNSDKETYEYNYDEFEYSEIVPFLTNQFDNTYLTQRFGTGYRMFDEKTNFTIQFEMQKAQLTNRQYLPNNLNNTYLFSNILPSLNFNHKFDQQTNLRINYRSSTIQPSITQLQNVLDISNPLQLSIGNPDLKQTYSHFLMANFSNFSADFRNVFMAFFSINLRSNYISNAIIISQRDSLIDGTINLPAGVQFSKPINLGGYYMLNSFLTYGMPVRFISSNVNFSLGAIYSRTPGLINGIENFSNAFNINFMLNLSSNISTDIDFNLSSRANFSTTINTVREDLNNQYNNFMTIANLNWIIWEGFFLQLELRNQIFTGLTGNQNTNYTLLNLSIGKKLLADNQAEIKLYAFDILKQNKNIQTNISDYYYEFVQNRVLTQYIMLSFTYNLRNFRQQ